MLALGQQRLASAEKLPDVSGGGATQVLYTNTEVEVLAACTGGYDTGGSLLRVQEPSPPAVWVRPLRSASSASSASLCTVNTQDRPLRQMPLIVRGQSQYSGRRHPSSAE